MHKIPIPKFFSWNGLHPSCYSFFCHQRRFDVRVLPRTPIYLPVTINFPCSNKVRHHSNIFLLIRFHFIRQLHAFVFIRTKTQLSIIEIDLKITWKIKIHHYIQILGSPILVLNHTRSHWSYSEVCALSVNQLTINHRLWLIVYEITVRSSSFEFIDIGKSNQLSWLQVKSKSSKNCWAAWSHFWLLGISSKFSHS